MSFYKEGKNYILNYKIFIPINIDARRLNQQERSMEFCA